MNQDGTYTSIVWMGITAGLGWFAHISANDILVYAGIGAAITTIALNTKNYLKKDKK